MVKQNLTFSLRNLLKNKAYTLINLLGLSVGMSSSFLILTFVLHELSYDRFFENGERIYRINTTVSGKSAYKMALSDAEIAPELFSRYSQDIESFVRTYRWKELIRYAGDQRFETPILFVDPNFFEFFSFPLITGNPIQVLNNPANAVITTEAAKKYYGTSDPVGQVVSVPGFGDYVIRGVMKKPERNHFDFELVIPANSNTNKIWKNTPLNSYLLVSETTSDEILNAHLRSYMREYNSRVHDENTAKSLSLQLLEEIYLDNSTMYDTALHGNPDSVLIFSLSAMFIVLIAIVNYINLVTAKYTTRVHEVGIRKILGASRQALVPQFLTESFLVVAFSFLLSLVGLISIMPYFESFSGLTLSKLLLTGEFLVLLTLIFIVVIIATGVYPALVLSSMRTGMSNSGQTKRSWNTKLRAGLVVFQLLTSMVIVTRTLVTHQQLQYLSEKGLGFDHSRILVLPLKTNQVSISGDEASQGINAYHTFKNELLKYSFVQSAAMSSRIPGGSDHGFLSIKMPESGEDLQLRAVFTDYDFVKTYGLKILKGRNFDSRLDDSNSAIINISAARMAGFSVEEVVGKKLKIPAEKGWYEEKEIHMIGVVDDYHISSLHSRIEPLIIIIHDEILYHLSLRLSPGNFEEQLNLIEQEWEALAVEYPFEYEFLDETITRLYESERMQLRLSGIFGALAVFLASLGLYGLTLFSAETRIKEIAIRRVCGATVRNILMLLSEDFAKLKLFALILSLPVSYWLIERWLSDFAYRINISWTVFLISGQVICAVGLITLSFESYRAATANPVDGLRQD